MKLTKYLNLWDIITDTSAVLSRVWTALSECFFIEKINMIIQVKNHLHPRKEGERQKGAAAAGHREEVFRK